MYRHYEGDIPSVNYQITRMYVATMCTIRPSYDYYEVEGEVVLDLTRTIP